MNPDWTEEELILGLDTYFAVGYAGLHGAHPQIIELSAFLNRLPIHPLSIRDGKFRNPDGVTLTLKKFLTYDPTYSGKGLHPERGLKQEIWNKFAADRAYLRCSADAIRSSFSSLLLEQKHKGLVFIEDHDFVEGGLVLKLHLMRERNPALVRRKKAQTLQRLGCLECEVCGFDFYSFYGEVGYGFAECHHKQPLSKTVNDRKTRLTDLAIVCSNCHRMLHRSGDASTIEELRQIVTKPTTHSNEIYMNVARPKSRDGSKLRKRVDERRATKREGGHLY